MPTNLLTVSQTAAQLDVSPATVRRYATEFSDHLSSNATPPPGATRRFTPEDIQVMRVARNQLGLGETYETVNSLLDTVAIEPLSTPQGDHSSTPATTGQENAAYLATITKTAESLTAAFESATASVRETTAAIREATAQAAQLEARREARESRAERLQWAMLAVLTVATVAAVLLLAIR